MLNAYFFGEHIDKYYSQGLFNITHNVVLPEDLKENVKNFTTSISGSISSVTNNIDTVTTKILELATQVKTKLGDTIPKILESFLEMITESIIFAVIEQKNFMKTFAKNFAAKILVFCVKHGISHFNLIERAMKLGKSCKSKFLSQGLSDFDFTKVFSLKTISKPFLFTFICTTFYKIFTNSDVSDNMLSKLWKEFTSIPKKSSCLISDMKDTLNFIGDIFNLPIGKNEIKLKTEKLLSEITEMMAIKDNVNGFSRESDEISYVLEKAHKAFKLYQDYIELTKECEKWNLKGESKALSAIKTQLENLMKHYLAHAKYLQKDRKVPIFEMLRGDPGSGKTQLLNFLSNFHSRLNKPEMKSESRITDCFAPAQKSEYCDGYNPGTTTWIYDDLGTMVDSTTNPDPTFVNLINMVNNAPFPLNMSKAEEKGKVFFDSPFIIASTNQQRWNVKSINNVGALERRTFIDITVFPNPIYSMTYKNQGFDAVKIDPQKIDEANLKEGKAAGSFRADASLYLVRKSGQSIDEAEYMTLDQIVELIANEFYSRKYSINTKESTLSMIEECDSLLKQIESKYMSQGLSNDEDDIELEEYEDAISGFSYYTDIVYNYEYKEKFMELWNKAGETLTPLSQKVMDSVNQGLEKAMDIIRMVSNSIMTSFYNMWEKLTWKHTLLAMLPLAVLGLGYLAYNYFKHEDAVQREAIFGVYVVDDMQGWQPVNRQSWKNFEEDMKKASKNVIGKNFLLTNLSHDGWHMRVLRTYAVYDVRCKIGVMRDDLEKLKTCRDIMTALSEDVNFEIFDIFLNESRTYSNDNKIPKVTIEGQTYNKDNTIRKVNIESQTYNKDNTIQKVKIESQTYNKDNKIQRVNIEGQVYDKNNVISKLVVEGKGTDVMTECKSLFSQGHIDVNANMLLSNRLPSSTGIIHSLDSNDNIRGTMHITMLKGTIGVTASHLLIYACDKFRVRFINGRVFEFTKDELVLHVDEPKDLLFIEFPNRMNQFKDLTDLFICKSDYKHLIHTKGAMVSFPLNNNEELNRIAYKSGDVSVLHTDYTVITSAVVSGKEVEKVRRLDCLMYDINTDFGECGTCIVYMNNALPRKLAGIHIAGQNRSPSGMASIITQEYLKEILANCSWKSQVSYSLEQVYDFESAPIEEVLEDKPCDRVNILGRISNPPKQLGNTNVTKSVIHGVFTPETKPCHLRNTPEFDIFKLNSKKVSLKTKKIEKSLLDKAIADVSKVINCGQKEKLTQVFDTATAIQGIENVEYVDGVKRQTSPGFPYNKGSCGDGKRYWLGYEGDYIQNEEVHELVQIVVDNAKKGKRIPNLFVDSLKDERLPIEKVDAGKTRIFSNGDFIHTIAMRKYTLGFSAHMMQNKIENESGVGINVYAEWKNLAKFLQRDGKTKFVAGDFSGFDGTLNAQILWGIVDIIEDYYYNATEEDRRVRYTLFADLINSLRIQNGVLYECDHSQPSGNPLTVIINTLYNMIAIRIVYLLCKRSAGLPETLVDFRKYVNFVAYGDDNLYGIDDKIVSWFNQHTVTSAFEVIGMVYTDEAKTLDGNIPPYREFNDVGFLKRKFVKENGLWMCPIAERTIRELCNWTKKSDDNLQASIDNIEDAFKEAFFHGEKFYNEFTTTVNKAFKEYTTKNGCRANLTILPYSTLLEQHYERNVSHSDILF